jgi:hypothetical protein
MEIDPPKGCGFSEESSPVLREDLCDGICISPLAKPVGVMGSRLIRANTQRFAS